MNHWRITLKMETPGLRETDYPSLLRTTLVLAQEVPCPAHRKSHVLDFPRQPTWAPPRTPEELLMRTQAEGSDFDQFPCGDGALELGKRSTLGAHIPSLCTRAAQDALVTFLCRPSASLGVSSSREGLSPVCFCLQFPALCLAHSHTQTE